MIQSTPTDSKIVLQLQTGTDSKGAAKLHNRAFPFVKPTAADQDVFDVATAIGNLQTLQVKEIERQNTVTLTVAPTTPA